MSEIIKSENYDGESMTLIIEATFEPLRVGSIVTTFRGERLKLVGGRAPHKPDSSGKVWVVDAAEPDDASGCCEYYPNVVGARWIHDTTLAAHAKAMPVYKRADRKPPRLS